MVETPSFKLASALVIAMRAHAAQFDKAGDPYIFHVLDVWQRIRSADGSIDEQIVALLHDVVEDTPITLDTLAREFSDTIINAVDAITKRDGEDRASYLTRVKADRIARKVKLADAHDNFRRVGNIKDDAERARLDAKYRETIHFLDSKGFG